MEILPGFEQENYQSDLVVQVRVFAKPVTDM